MLFVKGRREKEDKTAGCPGMFPILRSNSSNQRRHAAKYHHTLHALERTHLMIDERVAAPQRSALLPPVHVRDRDPWQRFPRLG
jgi:hypothetical protein